MKLIQNTVKLDSYSLDNVASTYIKEDIIDIIDGNIIETKNTYGLKKDRYISIKYNDGLTPNNNYGRNQKFLVKRVEQNRVYVDDYIDKNKLDFKNCKVYWCQAKDNISNDDIFACYKGTPKLRALVGAYCIQDCVLLNVLMNKLNVLNNYVGMANVCNVPLSYLFMRGQGVRIFSLVAKCCRIRDHLIPLNKKFNDEVNFEDRDNNDTAIIIDKINSITNNNGKNWQ
jgi:ribosomal protein L19E